MLLHESLQLPAVAAAATSAYCSADGEVPYHGTGQYYSTTGDWPTLAQYHTVRYRDSLTSGDQGTDLVPQSLSDSLSTMTMYKIIHVIKNS